MFIKQVIIQGFKSYRNHTVIEPFDKHNNVIVGRNGSGKSNLFSAIQLIFTDEYSNLGSKQRQMLLHENSGAHLTNAYVEIIFDNADRRFPIDADEISLRRVIGLHVDQFILNKKNATRTEVMNLLESAGFTNSNPYYIVKQGTINQMALAPDSRRLQLLHEVAGTKLYNEKREESLKIFKNAEKRLEKIDEALNTLNEKLSTLEEEKEDLKQYHYYDKKKSAIEYSIHRIELNEYKTKLKRVDIDLNTSLQEKGKNDRNLKKIQEQIQDLMDKSKKTKNNLKVIKEEHESLKNEKQSIIEKSIKLDLTVNDLRDEIVDDKQFKKNLENELTNLELTIKEQESELDKVGPQYEAMKRKEEESIRNLTLKMQKRQELIAKDHRRRHFRDKDDRNDWIKNELKLLDNHIKEKKNHIEKLSADLKQDDEKYTTLIKKLENETRDINGQKRLIEEYNKEYHELKRSKDHQQTIRNELWRKEDALQQYYSSLKEDLSNAEQCLRLLTGKAILNGCESVRKVLKTFRERGGSYAQIADSYFGLVIDNISSEKTIYTPVEVTAKNKLFNHIVESDHVATMILKEMKQQNLPGEVIFVALNRLDPKEFQYPKNEEVVALVYKLNYDQKFDKVMKLIFGRTLICRTLELATQFAKEVRLDCVTLDGDVISSTGTLTGGYINRARSKLKIQTTKNEIISKLSNCENELKNIRQDLTQIEATINNQNSEMQRIEIKKSKANAIYDKIKYEITLIKEKLNDISSVRSQKEHSIYQVKAQFEQMQSSKENFELELKEELLSQPPIEDQTILESLKTEIDTLQRTHKEAFDERTKLEAIKNKFSNYLNNNLIKRRERIKLELEEMSMLYRENTMKNIKAEVEDNQEKLNKINQEFEVLDKKLKECNEQYANELEELNKCQLSEKNARIKFDESAKECQKFESKVNLLEKKIDEFSEKMKQLESLPSKIDYARYTRMTLNDLFRELSKTNKYLKKYSYVNKKALEQYIHISDEKERFAKQKTELFKGHEKIRELFTTLEEKKMEAIHFTFRQISQYFKEIFQKLVPTGRAKLLMKTLDNSEGREIGSQDTDADVFTGILIKVTFTNSDVEMKEINQLSGGQKSLVALSLIFAIQKCDPAPFYLLDEVDQALDAEHRQAVAKMIHELSDKAQFITSTFRPELLQYANKCYGVAFKDNVSQIKCVTKNDAREFVEFDQPC